MKLILSLIAISVFWLLVLSYNPGKSFAWDLEEEPQIIGGEYSTSH